MAVNADWSHWLWWFLIATKQFKSTPIIYVGAHKLEVSKTLFTLVMFRIPYHLLIFKESSMQYASFLYALNELLNLPKCAIENYCIPHCNGLYLTFYFQHDQRTTRNTSLQLTLHKKWYLHTNFEIKMPRVYTSISFCNDNLTLLTDSELMWKFCILLC